MIGLRDAVELEERERDGERRRVERLRERE